MGYRDSDESGFSRHGMSRDSDLHELQRAAYRTGHDYPELGRDEDLRTSSRVSIDPRTGRYTAVPGDENTPGERGAYAGALGRHQGQGTSAWRDDDTGYGYGARRAGIAGESDAGNFGNRTGGRDAFSTGPQDGYRGHGAYRDELRHRDPEYLAWRQEQLRLLDEDYDSWRKERYQRFSEEFNTWRATRSSNQDLRGSNQSGQTVPAAAAGNDGGKSAQASATPGKFRDTGQPGH